MRKQNLPAVLLVLTLAVGFSACDGGIQVTGRVYYLPDSKGYSQVLCDTPTPPVQTNFIPASGVKIKLFHAGDYTPEDAVRGNLWVTSTTSGTTGEFRLFTTTSPTPFNAAISVSQKGYKPVTRIFRHDRISHDIVVFLVPEKTEGSNN
ncbi:MAG: hypothetical protein K1Y36_17655 [Blastocatellia bacterium]|nr:hypothetical protein [Blastocatellia bacterium]